MFDGSAKYAENCSVFLTSSAYSYNTLTQSYSFVLSLEDTPNLRNNRAIHQRKGIDFHDP